MHDITNKIGIGTAQFGLDYGATNTFGKTPESEVYNILRFACAHNMHTIDTARGYGESENALGSAISRLSHSFKIVIKLPPLKKRKINNQDISFFMDCFEKSLSSLKASSVYALLLHYAYDFVAEGAEKISDLFDDLKSNGKIKKCGVSAYDQKELESVLSCRTIDLVQIPSSVLDQRLIKSGVLEDLKSRNIEIHVRSAFLQGTLLESPEKLSSRLSPLKYPIKKLHDFCQIAGQNPAAVALGFLLENKNIDRVICGVNTSAQLEKLYEHAREYKTLDSHFFEDLAFENDVFLNPANWPKT